MNIFNTTIGWIAAVVMILMYIPQTYKVLKSKSAIGLSKTTFPMVLVGSLCWVCFSMFPAPSWQAYVSNGVIIVLMVPIIYYLFDKNFLITFVAMIVVVVVLVMAAILISTSKVPKNDIAGTVFATIGGLLTGIPFIPQTVKTVISKDIKNISIMSTILVCLANILWTIFWTINAGNSHEGKDIVAASFSALGFITVIPLIFIYLKQKNK